MHFCAFCRKKALEMPFAQLFVEVSDLIKYIASFFIVLSVAALMSESYAWIASHNSKLLASQDGKWLSNAMPMGNSGFNVKTELLKPPPSNLYPGEVGEAVYSISNLSSIQIAFRIEGAVNAVAANLETRIPPFDNKFGFIASIATDSAADKALHPHSADGGVYYYGFLDKGETKKIRIRYQIRSGMQLVKKIEKLSIQFESCQLEGAAGYFGLNSADAAKMLAAIKYPVNITPTPLPTNTPAP
jgi:hypothetical protein